MKRTKAYNGLLLQATLILPEDGFLAGSKDEVINEDTEVIIDRQDGDITNAISFDNWE